MLTEVPARDGFAHEAFVYDDAAALVRGAADFIRTGVETGEAVLVAVPGEKLGMLRDELADVRDRVDWMDSAQAGHNPARMIPFWRELLAPHAEAGRPLRAVAELAPTRSSAEDEEAVLNEALLNLAFRRATGFRLRCPYDARTAPDELISTLERTHPVMLNGVPRPSPAFDPEAAAAAVFRSSLPARPSTPQRWPVALTELRGLRFRVRDAAVRHGLGEDRADDFTLATHEICKNSVKFAGGGSLAVWVDGDTMICEVADRGRITELLVGRSTPPPSAENGRGLWLANQLCDLVQIRSTDDGTVIRLHAVR